MMDPIYIVSQLHLVVLYIHRNLPDISMTPHSLLMQPFYYLPNGIYLADYCSCNIV